MKTEEALRLSEEKFSKVFNASLNPICIVTLEDFKFIEINESFTRFTGYTREEIIGRSWMELGLWVNENDLFRMTTILTENGRLYNHECRSRMKSGEMRTALFSADLMEIGGRMCLTLVITDITEQMWAEQALIESEEFTTSLLNNTPNPIFVTYPDSAIKYVNPAFEKLSGFALTEIIGMKAPYPWWPEETKREITASLREANFEDGTKKEMTYQKKNGESFWVEVNVTAIKNNGERRYILVNWVDITGRKKAEQHLRLLSSVTQQVTDSTIVTDQESKITYMNKAAQGLFGYSIDEVMGRDIALFDGAPLSEDTLQEMQNTISAGKTSTGMLTKRRKDGTTFLCDCRRSPMFDENGHFTSSIIVHRDVTEQKEIEAKLKAHKQLLESILTSMPEGVLVTDSSDTVVLGNESFRRIFHTGKKSIENKPLNEIIHVEQLTDLYKAMKKGNTDSNALEFRYKVRNQEKIITCVIIKMDGGRMLLTFTDVSREREEEDKLYLMDRLASLGEMAAGLAHELNNPLTGILTLSQLLVNSDIPEEPKEDLQCIYSEAKRAANIVKNVLLFTRNNSYENGQSSVNEVVKEVLRLREHEEKTSNINVLTNLQDNLPEIPLNKYQLQQVFLNIILNAEAAMKETARAGTLTVTTERVNNHVNIMFSDTGCGIKKDFLPRIFDPFFTTKEIGKGTGLGLSICYGIIVKHDGKISVKTRVGKGTTFTVRMPTVN